MSVQDLNTALVATQALQSVVDDALNKTADADVVMELTVLSQHVQDIIVRLNNGLNAADDAAFFSAIITVKAQLPNLQDDVSTIKSILADADLAGQIIGHIGDIASTIMSL